MKTLLTSQELWDLVEHGFVGVLEPAIEEKKRLRETKKNDANALFIIQQAIHVTIFSRITAVTTSKQAWSILQRKFQRDSKVITVKLQSLRRDFETLLMTNDESIAYFLSRTMKIVSQMHTYVKKILDETIVAKVLRSSTPKFDHVVAATEETKDLSILSIDELMGSLQSHEQIEVVEEENFAAFMVVMIIGIDREMMDKGNSMNKGISYNVTIAEVEEEEKLFMACTDINPKKGDLWFVDSGCSNHVTGTKSLFQELDETQRIKAQLENTKEIQVEGKGTVKVETSHGKIKLLDNDPKEMTVKEITVEVSPDEETRVNSSTSPIASTVTQNLLQYIF
ncbi:uncharacterized protein LOC111472160 [Cucurbita maxima]|uniref:Uncharacterized protein LOC111472160 n=1 Tax=Cucurbita maxima TaxID=3661 RepID=A0A6J1IEZ7_CUCMA|nr:uncharacterized protein LOC111472160 [Cucurbita maxima]